MEKDHRLVKAKVNIKWYKYKQQKSIPCLNVDGLTNTEMRNQYQLKVEENMRETIPETVQEKCNNIKNEYLKVAEENSQE